MLTVQKPQTIKSQSIDQTSKLLQSRVGESSKDQALPTKQLIDRIAFRIILGIFTVGISEIIVGLIKQHQARMLKKAQAQPVKPEPKSYKKIEIREDVRVPKVNAPKVDIKKESKVESEFFGLIKDLYQNPVDPSSKPMVISIMKDAIENNPNLKIANKIDQKKCAHFVKNLLKNHAKELFATKFNISDLIDALKDIDGIDMRDMMLEVRQELFMNPYQNAMKEMGYQTLDALEKSDIVSDYTPTKLDRVDVFGAFEKEGESYSLNQYMTFGYGDCGFVASHVPRSFMQEFLKDDTNQALYRLFATGLKPTVDRTGEVWDHFINVINSDAKYLDDTDVATLVNLFHDKHLFFLGDDLLQQKSGIDLALLPVDSKHEANRHFIRHAGAHYTYCALPGDEKANKIGRLKAKMSLIATDIRREVSPTNQGVETLNFIIG